MRVLLAIKSLGYGGAERLLTDLVATGDHEAFAYEVATVLDGGDTLTSIISSDGIPVHRLGASGNLDLAWMVAFRRLLVDGDFDIVHFHLPYTAALGRLVVRSLPRGRRPITLYTEHSMWNKAAVLIRYLNRATVGSDRALIAVSPAAYDALPRSLRPGTRVIVHGVDLTRSREMVARREELRAGIRSELGLSGEEHLAVAVANLRSEKGYDVLLDAAGVICARGLPIRFAAAGTGALEAELATRRHELGLDDRFRFLGHRNDAMGLLAAADVFVLASHQEGLPVALMEAMSVGTAIVATAVGGVPQVVHDGVNGLVVPPGDPLALADAIERVCSDPELRTRLGTHALVDSATFDVARASSEIEQLYRDLLDDVP